MKKAMIRQHYPLDYAGEEALNSICTNLAFIGTDKRKIVITSNTQSEGKSWMTMHIAENMARRGRHVVLVDADMRRSFMIQRYKIELEGEGQGLAHFLAGQCDLNDVVYETDVYGMCLIPAGRDVVNPVSLIDSPYFEQMLDALAQSFDMVIIDAPPIGMVIDAAEIAGFCDGSVLVLEYNHTRLREVAECKRQMEKSGTPVLGCIINKVSFEGLSAKKYYNKSYYSHYTTGYYKHDSSKDSSSGEAKA